MATKKKFSLLEFILRLLGLWRGDSKSDDEVSVQQSQDAAAEAFPYHLRDDFLSAAEFSFYSVLRETAGNQAVICAKVSLSDLFWVKRTDAAKHRTYTNKIDRKHIDFLLCDPLTMKPLLGIELDDKSHQREDRKQRDQFVDGVFAAAGLPLLHVPVKRAYVISEIAALLTPYLPASGLPASSVPANAAPPITETASAHADVKVANAALKAKSPAVPVNTQTDSAPRCPKCDGEMTLRTVKKGEHAGKRFWGCTNYPQCRSMLPYKEPIPS